jgi:hypothetical protein
MAVFEMSYASVGPPSMKSSSTRAMAVDAPWTMEGAVGLLADAAEMLKGARREWCVKRAGCARCDERHRALLQLLELQLERGHFGLSSGEPLAELGIVGSCCIELSSHLRRLVLIRTVPA